MLDAWLSGDVQTQSRMGDRNLWVGCLVPLERTRAQIGRQGFALKHARHGFALGPLSPRPTFVVNHGDLEGQASQGCNATPSLRICI